MIQAGVESALLENTETRCVSYPRPSPTFTYPSLTWRSSDEEVAYLAAAITRSISKSAALNGIDIGATAAKAGG
jgi:hypothetical protein